MPFILRVHLTGLLEAASMLTCMATVIGFAGQFGWVLDLAAHFRVQYALVHFRVQYALVLGLGALSAVVRRKHHWATVFAGFALLNISLLMPRFLPSVEAAVSDDAPVFRVLLANINSEHRHPEAVRHAIADEDPDFILLLEITPWMLEQLADLADGYPYWVAEPREDNSVLGCRTPRG